MRFAALLVTGALAAQPTPETDATATEVRPMTLGPGWAATKVNTSIFRHHAIVTHGATQIAAWYSPEGTVVFARRDLASAEWTTHDTGWKGNVRDAHNGISLGVSRDGILHVSYDHHGNPLRYRRSAEPLDPTTFGPLIPMTGSKEQRVTYPQFVHLDDGTLLFFYRDGSSGRGDLCVNRYAPEAAEWTALHHPLISGAGTHNPYWMRPAVGRDGDLQLGWCWRRTGAAETNSRVCYARSRDGGVTWESSGGAGYELPITPATGEVVLPVAEGQNLSNQDSSDVDSQGRFHAVFRKNDADGVTQYHHLWRDGDAWRCGVVSDFDEPYDIRGGGSLRTPLSRPNLCIDGDDTVYVLYRDNRRGSRPMVIPLRPPGYAPGAEFALSEENLLQWEPLFDVVRWRRDRVLDLFVQATDQGDHETTTDRGAELVKVVEWRP